MRGRQSRTDQMLLQSALIQREAEKQPSQQPRFREDPPPWVWTDETWPDEHSRRDSWQ